EATLTTPSVPKLPSSSPSATTRVAKRPATTAQVQAVTRVSRAFMPTLPGAAQRRPEAQDRRARLVCVQQGPRAQAYESIKSHGCLPSGTARERGGALTRTRLADREGRTVARSAVGDGVPDGRAGGLYVA